MNFQQLYPALLFAIVSSPKMYEFVRHLVGYLNKSWQDLIATASGRPNVVGLILHTLVFAFLLRFVTQRAGYLNAGQTGALSGSLISQMNQLFLGGGDKGEKDCSLKVPPSDPLPDLPPTTEADIAKRA
jgi:hypothetical protein